MTAKTKSAKIKTVSQAVAATLPANKDAQAIGLQIADAMRAIAARMSTDASKKACEQAAGTITTHATLIGERVPEHWQDALNRDSGKKLARIAAALASGAMYGRDPEAMQSNKHGKVDGSVPFYVRALLEGEQTRKGMLAAAMQAERYKDAAGAQAGYSRQALWLAGIAAGNVRSKNAELTIVDKAAALQMLPPEVRSLYESQQGEA